ncbi:MAG: hypothetical protein AAFX02_08470 [Pseudomonadota bacterium]
MINTFVRPVAVLAVFIVFLLGPATADPSPVGKYKDWRVYVERQGSERICFATTKATDEAPREAKHGEVWFYVTRRSSNSSTSSASLKVGYPLREDLPPSARIGRTTWTLYAAGPEAFVHDEDERSVLRALKRGSELRVEAISQRDTPVAYHFSLAGSSAAIDKAAAVCR